MAAPGQLGFIIPSLRTDEQSAAHELAMAGMPKFALQYTAPPGPVKVMLTDFWKAPDVVADIGVEFKGFYQFTGSCVGASKGNGGFTLSAVQRMIADNPTKAYIPFWPWGYGMTRLEEGDQGQGEGAVDSVMGKVAAKLGDLESTHAGLPIFNHTKDGIQLSKSIEMQWSDGGRIDPKWKTLAAPQTMTVAPLKSPDDIKACILNGYPVLDGCDNYVGNGHIKGSGADAYVTGRYDGAGGHSTCFLGYWDHPNDGPLFEYSNQWTTATYPIDPAGAGRCCVWLPLSEVEKLFRTGGDKGETMGMSHLNYFPAQPKVIDYLFAP